MNARLMVKDTILMRDGKKEKNGKMRSFFLNTLLLLDLPSGDAQPFPPPRA